VHGDDIRGNDDGSASSVFDLSPFKIIALVLIGLIVFGPEQLPRMAAQAGQVLRDMRKLMDRARADLADNLGPEFAEFDLNDLNPRTFVRKHLLDGLDDDEQWSGQPEILADGTAEILSESYGEPERLTVGEVPPWDAEAT